MSKAMPPLVDDNVFTEKPSVEWPDGLYYRHLSQVVAWHRSWWHGTRKHGQSMCGDNYAYLLGWSMDFFRALYERPRWVRWLLRLVLGRHAYRELVGLRDMLDRHGWDTHFEYGCQNAAYHKDKVSL